MVAAIIGSHSTSLKRSPDKTLALFYQDHWRLWKVISLSSRQNRRAAKVASSRSVNSQARKSKLLRSSSFATSFEEVNRYGLNHTRVGDRRRRWRHQNCCWYRQCSRTTLWPCQAAY